MRVLLYIGLSGMTYAVRYRRIMLQMIAITETWISYEISQYYLYYNRFAKCRSGCEEGVLVFLALRYTVMEFSPPVPAPQSCEMLCVKDVSTCQHWVLIYKSRHNISLWLKCDSYI